MLTATATCGYGDPVCRPDCRTSVRHWPVPIPCDYCEQLTDQSIRCGRMCCPTCQATAPAPKPEPVPAPRFLTALEGECAPRRRVDGRMRAPFWRPDQPDPLDAVEVVSSWSWRRPYTGSVVVLDRAGAFLAAASSCDVAHGALEHTGPVDFTGRPGMYKITAYPWHETGVPNPLGREHPAGREVWVMAPRVKLLADLVDAGRWPDAAVIDSYTGDPVRLNRWTKHVQAERERAIRVHGRSSAQYDAVKTGYSQALALMLGTREPGHGRRWKCGVHRPDWTLTVQDQAAVTIWRWADGCRQTCRDHPPVGMRNVDELVIPTFGLDVVTSVPRPGGRAPLRLDPDGIALGTFRVKGVERW